MEYFCQFPFPLIPEKPFPFSPAIPTLQDPQQPKLGNFALFILFNWIFQLYSLIFPLPRALLLERNSLLHSGIPKFPPQGWNSSCPWQPLIVDRKSSLKFLFPPKSSNSIFFPIRKSGFLWILDLQALLFPFLLNFLSFIPLNSFNFQRFQRAPCASDYAKAKEFQTLWNVGKSPGSVRTGSNSLEFCSIPKYSYLSKHSMKEK